MVRILKSACWLVTLLTIVSLARAEDEWQYWLGGKIVAKTGKNWTVTGATQSRLNDRGSFVHEHYDLGVAFTGLPEWVDVSANYRVIFREDAGDEWKRETRPHLNATMRFEMFGLAISDRVRLEYNDLEDLGDTATVRNKISVNPPYYLAPAREGRRLGHHRMRPFASYELFYNTDQEGVTNHRFRTGLSTAFDERVFGDLYYMRQENTLDFTDVGLNIAGVNIKLLF